MPKWMLYVILLGAIVLMIPPAVIAQYRNTLRKTPRIHLIQDMDHQVKMQAQQTTPMFTDTRVMRPPVEGAVAQSEVVGDDHYNRGLAGEQWAVDFPGALEVNREFILRGQERFNIYCTPCHGAAGFGDGIVHERAMRLLDQGAWGTTWVQPLSLHDATVMAQPNGQIFNTITHGVRTMPSYGEQIPIADRWAIVAYIRALQRSQSAQPDDLPEGVDINALEVEAAPAIEEESGVETETEATDPELPEDATILDSGVTAP